jgi:hypothetical protein
MLKYQTILRCLIVISLSSFITVLFTGLASNYQVESVAANAAPSPTPSPSASSLSPTPLGANSSGGSPGPSSSPPPSPSPPPFPQVKDVYRLDKKSVAGEFDATMPRLDDEARQAGMGDIIVVKVSRLRSLLNHANCVTDNKEPVPNCTKQNIVLYLDGRAIKGLVPESGAPIPEEETLRFHLQRTDTSDEEWADLLGKPPIFSDRKSPEGSLFIRPVEVSVGLEKESAIPTDVKRFSFVRVHEWLFWGSLVVLIGLLFALYILAKTTNLLRDDIPVIGEPAKASAKSKQRQKKLLPPYSLGRWQMAFWFFLIITSFIFIFVITWQVNTVTEQALALIGISAATALGAIAVDSNKEADTDIALQDSAQQYSILKAERAELKKTIEEFQDKTPRTETENIELVKNEARLRELNKQIKGLSTVSQSFINDVLTDIHGYSFHRLQIFVWTIVLGSIFLHGVYNRLAMPNFSATLLALLGISGATYIGFKIPEKQQPTSK